MSQKSSFFRLVATGFKVLLLTGIMFVLFSTAYTVAGVSSDPSLTSQTTEAVEADPAAPTQELTSGPESTPASPADQSRTALILLGVCFLQSVTLSVVILHSRWTGWKLYLALFTVMFLGMGIVSHIDSLFFLRDLSRQFIGKMVLASLLLAASFPAIAIWILGRARSDVSAPPTPAVEHPSLSRWAVILLVLTLLHVVLYFVFGYYVAWQSPELRAFYGGEDPGSFWLQMADVVQGSPLLIPVQMVRGILWSLMAIVLVYALEGSRWSAAAITAAVFVGLFAVPLALPNPIMPDAVRQAHLIETILSRGLYGFLAVWFLRSSLQVSVADVGLTQGT